MGSRKFLSLLQDDILKISLKWQQDTLLKWLLQLKIMSRGRLSPWSLPVLPTSTGQRTQRLFDKRILTNKRFVFFLDVARNSPILQMARDIFEQRIKLWSQKVVSFARNNSKMTPS